jgi:hypothetical protein
MSIIKTISESSSRCLVVKSKALPCVIQNPMHATGELQVSKSHWSMTVGFRPPMGYTSSFDHLRISVTDRRLHSHRQTRTYKYFTLGPLFSIISGLHQRTPKNHRTSSKNPESFQITLLNLDHRTTGVQYSHTRQLQPQIHYIRLFHLWTSHSEQFNTPFPASYQTPEESSTIQNV